MASLTAAGHHVIKVGDRESDLGDTEVPALAHQQLRGISNSVGSAWATPAYNRAGNMTTVPQPADPTKGYTVTYDAWNRLVKIVDVPTGQTVQENAFDGRTFRAVRKSYTAGVLSETRQLFYSTCWQVIEERIGAATAAERQFVWGLRYIDDLVVRDRDTTGGGPLNERLYALQDANWNVVALANSGGTIQERYAYSAYGVPAVLTGAFSGRGTSSYVWESLYCGYRWETAVALYLVRNRNLDSKVGWGQRDPILKWNGESFYDYSNSTPITRIDPLGLESYKALCNRITKSLESDDAQCTLSFDEGWSVYCREFPKGNYRALRKIQWRKGCVGVTTCIIGRPESMNTTTGWFRKCYATFGQAHDALKRNRADLNGRCAGKNMAGKPAHAKIIGFTWVESQESKKRRKICPECGFFSWNGTHPERGTPGEGVFDFGCYDEDRDCFWHADFSEETADSSIKLSRPKVFHDMESKRSAVFCIICDGDDLATLYK